MTNQIDYTTLNNLSHNKHLQHVNLKNQKRQEAAIIIGIITTTIATVITIALGAFLSSWPILGVGISLNVIIFMLSGFLVFLRKKSIDISTKASSPLPPIPTFIPKPPLTKGTPSLTLSPTREYIKIMTNQYGKKLAKKLTDSWRLKSNPKDASVTLFCPNNGIYWTIARYNIILPFLVDANLSSVVVNSTNQQIEKTSNSGVNSALSKIIPNQCWEESKEGKNQLILGEAVGGKFVENHQRTFPSGTLMKSHTFIIHAYTPNVYHGSIDLDADLQLLKLAYTNTFKKAEALLNKTPGVIHLPLFSTGKSAPKEEPQRSKWLLGANIMLEEAIQELPSNNCIQHIVLLDHNERPTVGTLALELLNEKNSKKKLIHK